MRLAAPTVAATTLVMAVLLLTGCTGTPDTAEKPTPQDVETVETPAPLVAETPDGDPTDTAFLAEARQRISVNAATSIPNATDEQLIAAGKTACTELADGTKFYELRLIDGETADSSGLMFDTGAIATAAILYYCPELNVPETFE